MGVGARWLCGIALMSSSGCSFLLDFDELEGDATATADTGETDAATDDTGTATDDVATDSTDAQSDVGGTDTEETGVIDETDQPTDDTGVTDVTEGTDAGSQDFGDGGDGLCSNGCNDDDPCTEDVCTSAGCDNPPIVCQAQDPCMEASCVDGKCVETPFLGVVKDNYDESVVADTVYRSELIGAGDRFFRATYGVWDGSPDIRLASFDRTATEPLAEYSLSQAFADLAPDVSVGDSVPVSPAALVADTRLGLTLNVYVAIRSASAASDMAGQVVRMTLNQNLALVGDGVISVSTEANYRVSSNFLGPAAGQPPNEDPYVVWNGCTTTTTTAGGRCVATEPTANGRGGLYFQIGDVGLDPSAPGDNFIADPLAVSGLAAVTTEALPGAMWMSNLAPTGVEVNTGFADGEAASPLVQCDTASGYTGYRLDAARSISNVWTAFWSKRGGSNFVGELTSLQCQSSSCVDLVVQPPASECPDPAPSGRVLDTARSLVARTLARPGDPANRIYQSFALARSGDESADLALVVNRVDFGNESGGEASGPLNIEERTLAAGTLDNAPDWPALATVVPDSIAVSWIEAGDTPDSDALRVQRYKICFGD